MLKSIRLRPPRQHWLALALCAAILPAPLALVTTAQAVEVSATARIESHVQDMHAKLHIRADQEEQWKEVAQAMRDNEAAIAPLILERKADAAKMSAIEDLDSYAQITSAHVDGIRNFTRAFTVLYGVMSPEQRSDADAMFRHGIAPMAKAK